MGRAITPKLSAARARRADLDAQRWLSRAFLPTIAIFMGLTAIAAEPIHRSLADLVLGDSLEAVRLLYVPTRAWPKWIEPKGRVTRCRIERTSTRIMPTRLEELTVGFKQDKLVEIEAIFHAAASREKTAEEWVADFSHSYGASRDHNGANCWSDERTVLCVTTLDVPVITLGIRASEKRVVMRLYDAGLSERIDL